MASDRPQTAAMPDPTQQATGFAYAFGAYGIWGVVFPTHLILMNRLVGGEIAQSAAWSVEVVAHRVVWCLLLCLALVRWKSQLSSLVTLLRTPRLLRLLGISSTLIAANWICFIYGAGTGRLSHASLGYYINPLLSVLLGVIFLGEGLRPMQIVALGLAAAGVIYQTIGVGELPWIALVVAGSFGTYGLLRKRLGIAPLVGLSVETGYVAVFAMAYFAWSVLAPADMTLPMRFGADRPLLSLMLLVTGLWTAMPLLWFVAAASRLRLATLGLMQYMAPTMQFVIAFTLNNEPFGPRRLVVFGLIWLGVGIFAWDSLRSSRQAKRAEAPAAALPAAE